MLLKCLVLFLYSCTDPACVRVGLPVGVKVVGADGRVLYERAA